MIRIGAGPVHGVLHCNVNTADVAAAHGFYADLLGLERRMRTRSENGDGGALGIEGTTDTDTWFLYDTRGPRIAPALEIVQWNAPALAHRESPPPTRTGLNAIGFEVSDVAALKTSEPHGPGPLPHRGGKATCLRVIGPDGVVTELAESREGVEAPRLSHLRINCTDLDASIAWYGALGFAPLAEARRAALPGWALGIDGNVEADAVSLALPHDPSFTLELLRWHRPAGRSPEPAVANSQGLYRMALAVNDVREALATVAGLAASRTGEPTWVELPGTPLGGVLVLFLRDPDGVVVELVERPPTALAKRT